jgi:hypothetical protein
VVLVIAPLMWPYRLARQSLLLRPSNWRLVPQLLKESRRRLQAELEGIHLGLAKRADVWSLKAIGTPAILRWLLKGSGPV